jgi:2-oxoglutarate ferredoxin oxidoreductase subunit beta
MKTNFTKDDFSNQNEVRWCPGCGDYAILSALQKTFAQLGLPPEEHVIVSGIGCSGRLPYYMNTFGYHTIHGRATAVATGLKLTRPELTVWIITGDGDALSIGGNHLLHLLRRNINVNILLFNNQVYGLTKGQFSPTSKLGQITKTSPQGVQQNPLNTLQFALGCGASFVARSIDKDPAHLSEVLQAAYQHKGCSFIEIYQDCHVFNSGAFDDFSTKTQRNHHVIYLQAQQVIRYGEQGINGLSKQDDGLQKSIVPEDFIIHQPENFDHAMRLARLNFPEFPVPVGVFYQTDKGIYSFPEHSPASIEKLEQLYRKGAYWSVTS